MPPNQRALQRTARHGVRPAMRLLVLFVFAAPLAASPAAAGGLTHASDRWVGKLIVSFEF